MYDPEYFIGDPGAQMDDWILQDAPDNCAVAAEMSIINQFISTPLSIDEASYISDANGWYQPGGGTSPEQVGQLMDAFGVLVQELRDGHGVIVGVNSSELWDEGIWGAIKQFFLDAFGLDDIIPADHAVVVTGIDNSDPATPMVIINDSGMPNGAAVRYPLDQFMDAWENSGFYYVATSIPIPHA